MRPEQLNQFVEHSENKELKKYNIQGQEIELELDEKVFTPSAHGLFLAENIRVKPNETVADVGTGSGILGILAARLGGKVYATDINPDSIDAANSNAKLNNVSIETKQGNFFADNTEKFDVIIGNLPQKLVLSADGLDTGHAGIDGGDSGNKIILEFLDEAKKRMYPNSRLYILVYSLTDSDMTHKEIGKNFHVNRLGRRRFIEDQLINENPNGYTRLKEKGKVHFSKQDKHFFTYETAYELMLKSQ